jgi:type II secretory pathway pseudopilin PulG
MVRFHLARFHSDRRRAQAGTTLVELLVSLVIIGFAITLIVGTFSTGVIDSNLAKRNTASQAVVQYELDKISASVFGTLPPSYSECFATDNPTAPGSCPGGSFALRADVVKAQDVSPTAQLWMVTISSLLDGAQVGAPVSVYKVSR